MVARVPSPKGRCLFLAGILFIMVGLSNIVTAEEVVPGIPSYQAYAAQFRMVESLVFWGTLFVLAGLWAIFSTFRGKYYSGFFSLMLMSMWWAGLFGASLLMTGYTRIIPSIFTWGLISVFLYTISSWQEVNNEE
jgi:hypothetical protein